jgi:hypothetical protein
MAKGPVATCRSCGKLCFRTRKEAKTYQRRYLRADHLNVYKCGDYFHLGHMPYLIARGVVSSRDYAS